MLNLQEGLVWHTSKNQRTKNVHIDYEVYFTSCMQVEGLLLLCAYVCRRICFYSDDFAAERTTNTWTTLSSNAVLCTWRLFDWLDLNATMWCAPHACRASLKRWFGGVSMPQPATGNYDRLRTVTGPLPRVSLLLWKPSHHCEEKKTASGGVNVCI